MILEQEAAMGAPGITRDALLTAVKQGMLPPGFERLEVDGAGTVGILLADLHNEGAVDAIEYLLGLNTDWPHQVVFRLELVLESFGGALRDDVVLISRFFQGASTLASAYHLEKAFKIWCESNSADLAHLVALWTSSSADCPLLPALLSAYRAIAPADALLAAMALTRDVRPEARRQSILVLGSFEHDPESIGRVGDRLLELLSSATTSDLTAALITICRLVRRHQLAPVEMLTAIQQGARDPNLEVRRVILSGLLGNATPLPGALQETRIELIRTLRISEAEDMVLLNRWLYDSDLWVDRVLVLDVLTVVLNNSGTEWNFNGLHGLGLRTSARATDALGWFVVSWLLEGSQTIRDKLHELFPPLDDQIRIMALEGLDLTPADHVYLARKVFVHLMFAHGPAVSILSSLLISLKGSKRRELEQVVADFWLRNFPGDLALFEAAGELLHVPGLKASIARMRKKVADYREPLKALPRNPAMRPTSLERRFQAEIARDRNREVTRAAGEASSFASMMSTSILLYGRSSVTYVRADDTSEPIRRVVPLHSFSTSTPIPTMDVLAPAHLNYLLHRFRSEARPR